MDCCYQAVKDDLDRDKDTPFSALEAIIAAEKHQGSMLAVWGSIRKKQVLLEEVQILDFLLERMKVHGQYLHDACVQDQDHQPGEYMRDRAFVTALSTMGTEFSRAPQFAKDLLQHLDHEIGSCLISQNEKLKNAKRKIPRAEDADKLLSSWAPYESLQQKREELECHLVSNSADEKAVVIGTALEIHAWQKQQGFTVSGEVLKKSLVIIDERCFENLAAAKALHYPSFWWVAPVLGENSLCNITFGIHHSVQQMILAKGYDNSVFRNKCKGVYLANEIPSESSIEAWRQCYGSPGSPCPWLCWCSTLVDGKELTAKCLSGGYEKFETSVTAEIMPQFQFSLTRLRAALLGRIDMANTLQQKLLAFSVSAGFAAFSLIGHALAAKLNVELGDGEVS